MNKDDEYVWLNEESKKFLYSNSEYIEQGKSVDDRVTVIGKTAEDILGISGFADKFKSYFKKGWFSLSTPIWTNFGTDRGMPISCFSSYIEDDCNSIVDTQSEVSIMSKYGGGTSAYFGKLRPRGSPIKDGQNGFSNGPVSFMQIFNTTINIFSQGSTRRGSFAAYLDIEHPDILEFLAIKSPGSPIQDISFGVCVGDQWMKEMIAGDKAKRKIWAKVLEARCKTGYPYIFFRDTVNRNTVDVYKDKGLSIHCSNLCTEILEPTNKYWSFVCDLLSVNILYYRAWKDSDLIEMLIYFLDAVMTDFINRGKKEKHLARAVKFAEEHRALGLGWLGYHSFLQKEMVPFESMQAKLLNVEIAKHIYDKAYAASRKMAKEYGVAPIMEGYDRRHPVLLAIAPTTSSSFILGQVAPSIQPIENNYHVLNLAKGKYTYKNPQLEALLESKGQNKKGVWKSILEHEGSVQHLDFLNQQEKMVFKTFKEIAPMETLIQAAQRQKYIDQGQSLNLIIDPSTPTKELNALIIWAWENEIKTLYYQINESAAQQLGRSLLTCTSCEA